MNLIPGMYVTHAKMPELGSGEVMFARDGTVSIRFGSGNRAFRVEMVMRHLARTTEAPQAPQKGPKRARKPKATKELSKPAARAARVGVEPTVI